MAEIGWGCAAARDARVADDRRCAGPMISHRHRCIYVKVPKCASTSVLDWFLAHGGGRHSFPPEWHGGPLSKRIAHVTRAMNLYPDYVTFTFLRNPYERFVSTWLHLRRVARARGGASPSSIADFETLRSFAELCAALLADFGPCWGQEAVAAFRGNRRREYGTGQFRIGDIGWSADHLWPQTAFVPDCHPERLFGVPRANADPLSFIGSVGCMDEDFRWLSNLLDLPVAPLPRSRAAPACAHTRLSGGYAEHYDKPTRRLVEALYATDLEFTGFGFDDGRVRVAVPGRRDTMPARQPRMRRSLRTLPSRTWRALWSLEAGAVERVMRVAAVRRAAIHLADASGIDQGAPRIRDGAASSVAFIEACASAGVRRLVLTSSAAVYGAESGRSTAYGRARLATETAARTAFAGSNRSCAVLRCFNVAGADPDLRAGPRAGHGLLRAACEAALGMRESVTVFGADWDTADGTCVRDYVHATDVAAAHLAALEALARGAPSLTADCGTGEGRSVLEALATVERACGRSLVVREGPRRPGDVAVSVATPERIARLPNWRPRQDSLDAAVSSALAWTAAWASGDAGCPTGSAAS